MPTKNSKWRTSDRRAGIKTKRPNRVRERTHTIDPPQYTTKTLRTVGEIKKCNMQGQNGTGEQPHTQERAGARRRHTKGPDGKPWIGVRDNADEWRRITPGRDYTYSNEAFCLANQGDHSGADDPVGRFVKSACVSATGIVSPHQFPNWLTVAVRKPVFRVFSDFWLADWANTPKFGFPTRTYSQRTEKTGNRYGQTIAPTLRATWSTGLTDPCALSDALPTSRIAIA